MYGLWRGKSPNSDAIFRSSRAYNKKLCHRTRGYTVNDPWFGHSFVEASMRIRPLSSINQICSLGHDKQLISLVQAKILSSGRDTVNLTCLTKNGVTPASDTLLQHLPITRISSFFRFKNRLGHYHRSFEAMEYFNRSNIY